MGFLRMTEELGQTLIIAEHGVIGNHKEAARLKAQGARKAGH